MGLISQLVAALTLLTTALPVTPEELRDHSDLVVVARVGARTSRWEAGRIYTRVQLEVLDTWKGRTDGTLLDVDLLGGVVGHIGQTVSGEARLVQDETVLLFLVQATGVYRVAAMEQGVWPLTWNQGWQPTLHANLRQRLVTSQKPVAP